MMEKRNQEYFKYVSGIAEELEQYYNGEIVDEETGENLTLYDYFSDVLDINYIINNDLSYNSVKVYITLGGPTVWIDTHTGTIELRWANENATYYLDNDIVNDIDEIWEEYYNCMR
jgi:hypothetical protein